MDLKISQIDKKSIGKKLFLNGIIDSIQQTTGPTLFNLNDGTGTLTLKAFEGAGVRAFAEINAEDYVKVFIRLNEFNNAFEGEIIKIDPLKGGELEKTKQEIEKEFEKRAKPAEVEFLNHNKTLEKLKPLFLQAAREIKLAIIKNRPILIRHHNDADGYSSGYALERAILPLIRAQHGNEKALRQYYSRAPSNSPFYEIEDSIKDTADSLADLAKFSEKIPLILIVDTGSSKESQLAIQQGRVHGIEFIVIDHHFFEEDVISKEVLVHINPFLVGEDGSKYSAGMLCTEIARFINPVDSIEHIPALAGLADMIDNPEIMTNYLKIASKKGYDKGLLHDIASVIDYVSTKLRFMEAREYVEIMFGEDVKQQKKLVALLAPYIRKLEEKNLEIAENTVKLEKHGKTNLGLLYIEESFSRGTYPKPGKTNGLLHDKMKKSHPKLISAGVLSDAITIRATEETSFSVHDLIAYLEKNLSTAFVEGGGHKNAGAIKFVPSKKEEVVNKLREFVSQL